MPNCAFLVSQAVTGGTGPPQMYSGRLALQLDFRLRRERWILLEKVVGQKQQTFSWCPASVAAVRARCVGAARSNLGCKLSRKFFVGTLEPTNGQHYHLRTRII